MNSTAQRSLSNLPGIAALFLRLGATAFGGPAAHIALMENEIVVQRGWLSRPEFLDLLGAVNLIPGPKSTEMALFIGYRRAGWPGLIVAGLSFILPAVLIVTAIAWAYVRYGKLPEAEGLLYGIKPIMIAVVAEAVWNLGRTALRTWLLGIAGVGAAALAWRGINPVLVLLIAGAFILAFRAATQSRRAAVAGLAPVVGSGGFRLLSTAGTLAPFSLWPMFLFFLKAGLVMFGSSYVLLAFLHTDLVEHRQWLTASQLLDAVAVGQFTPGPLFTTATFVGYVLGGWPAALAATAAIFLPAFALCAAVGPFAARLRESRLLAAFMDGVNVAALALMVVVTWQLAPTALVDWLTISLAVAALVWLLLYRVNSTWLILAGAAIGLARYMFEIGP